MVAERGHPGGYLLEPDQRGDCERPGVRDRSAEPAPPALGLRDEVLEPGQHRAADTFESFVEQGVDGVGQPGDVRVPAVVERLRLPDAGAVQVRGGTVLVRLSHLRDEVVPIGQQAADLALRRLDQQRRGPLADLPQRGEVRGSGRLPAATRRSSCTAA